NPRPIDELEEGLASICDLIGLLCEARRDNGIETAGREQPKPSEHDGDHSTRKLWCFRWLRAQVASVSYGCVRLATVLPEMATGGAVAMRVLTVTALTTTWFVAIPLAARAGT